MHAVGRGRIPSIRYRTLISPSFFITWTDAVKDRLCLASLRRIAGKGPWAVFEGPTVERNDDSAQKAQPRLGLRRMVKMGEKRIPISGAKTKCPNSNW